MGGANEHPGRVAQGNGNCDIDAAGAAGPQTGQRHVEITIHAQPLAPLNGLLAAAHEW